jgi:hypothetical protein
MTECVVKIAAWATIDIYEYFKAGSVAMALAPGDRVKPKKLH